MAEEILIFDASGSNVDGTDPGSPLSIGPGTSYPLAEASFPAPPLNVMYASSVDTEGEQPVARRYGNRTVTLRIGMDESGAVNTLADALAVKFAKLQREGGTLKRTRKDGTVRIYDIVAGDGWDQPYDVAYLVAHSSDIPVSLPARPFARGTESDLGDNVETTLPALVVTEASIPGDVEALGRLVIDNDVAADQGWAIWGVESRNYSSSANAALYYEAEGRTAMGGSAIAAGPTGASGAGSNVMRNTSLATTYQAILSTQATGGGAHLSHIGTFRVFARVQVPTTNTGTVSVALEWADGDFRRFTQNATATVDATWEGSWRLVDLGLVSPTKVTSGTQRWEGRVLAKSTQGGDDVDIDFLMLVPVGEGSGEIAAVLQVPTATSFSARDEFDQTAGALSGKTLPVGGTWSIAGSATGVDFAVDATDHKVTRIEPDSVIRFARAGAAVTWTDVAVQADVATTSGSAFATAGIFARYVDTTNYAFLAYEGNTSTGSLSFSKRIAGTFTDLATIPDARSDGTYYTLKLYISSTGRWAIYRNGVLMASGNDSVFATGGTLASGGAGLYDDPGITPPAPTNYYDNFAVWVPAADAAVFASQSAEIRHDRVRREDSGGTLWPAPSSYIGDYLLVPPSGAEARTARLIVKLSRNPPGEGPDSAIDDLSARLFVTPRYL